MTKPQRHLLWAALGGIAASIVIFFATFTALKTTSTTDFCLSCHSMQIPYEEYQGSVHFTNAKGIRAECSDCHIPNDTVSFLWAKIRATKDIYHHYVTGKIDTEDKFEQHREAMAKTVWQQFRANDSQTCRSCHSFEAMDRYQQSEQASNMHQYAIENQQTCIDCHKGVAHFAPEPELDSQAYKNLITQATNTDTNASNLFSIGFIDIQPLGTIHPAVAMHGNQYQQGKRQITLSGYQMKGAEQVLYMGKGQRNIIATLSKQGQSALITGEFSSDAYNNQWRTASLTTEIQDPVLSSAEPIWQYAEQLDNVYCATCHAKIPSNHFSVNAWGPVAKGMGERTDISPLDLEILTKFFQNHAKDVIGH